MKQHTLKPEVLSSETLQKYFLQVQYGHLQVQYGHKASSGNEAFALFEPSHEVMVLFILRKLILQTCMHSHPVGLDV